MAYNNGFPATYQPMYYQPQYQQPTIQQPNNGVIWVQGEAGAKSYLVAPNNTVQLWDSESQTIYLKSADASGMPTMKVLDYTIRESTSTPSPAASSPSPQYATKEDLDALKGQIEGLKMRLGKIAKKEASDE